MDVRLILSLILLVLAVPTGLLISWYTRDELVAGRKIFVSLIIASIAGVLWFFLVGNLSVSLTFLFILIVSLTSLVKSKDAGWVRKRRV